MTWLLLAILAPFLYAIVGYVDKILINFVKKNDEESDIGSLVLYSSLYGLVVSLISFVFFDVRLNIGLFNTSVLFLIGLLSIVWIVLYLKALEFDEVSIVTPLFLLIPVFTYVLELFVFGSVINKVQMIGIVFILLGGLVLNFQFELVDNKKKIKINKRVLFMMVGASAIISVIGVLFKYVTIPSDFWSSIFWEHIGLGAAGIFILIFFKRYRRDFLGGIKTYGYKVFGINILNETLTILGNLSKNFATLLISITAVYSIETFQPVFMILIGLFITTFFPKLLDEDFSKKTMFKKVVPILVMVAGAVLLA